MAGRTLEEQGVTREIVPKYYSVKEAVFPFAKFPGVDVVLGPEMKSTGEVMGVGRSFAEAFAKAQLGAGVDLPAGGKAFISVRDVDKPAAIDVARTLRELGFNLVATHGTAAALEQAGVECVKVNKVGEGRPHIVDMLKNDDIDLIVNTTEGRQALADSYTIRRSAIQHKVCYTTTMAGARVTCMALQKLGENDVHRLQNLHRELMT